MSGFEPVPTRAAMALQQKRSACDFQAIVFEEPKYVNASKQQKQEPRSQQISSVPQNRLRVEKSANTTPEFDIKQARHEVVNFAISNQENTKNKKKMRIAQAVKLGAKPPRKVYKNYKYLLEERKRLDRLHEERKQFHLLGKNKSGVAAVKCRSKTKLEKQNKKRAPVSSIDQHYGVANPKLRKKQK